MTQTIVYVIIGINVLTFITYGIDKFKAKHGSWRISEATLLLLAVIGGSIGALLGMKVWHHKTMHKKFKYGLPLILLAQTALVCLLQQTMMMTGLTSCSDNDDNNNDNQKRVAVLLPDGASLARWTTDKASLAFRQSTLRLPL